MSNLKATQTDFLGRLQYARELEPWTGTDEFGNPIIYDYFIRAEVEYVYDALDRLTQIIHRGGGSVLASSGGHLTGAGQNRSFTYDTWGRAQSETTPEAGTVSYTYTTNDQVATTTNANNKITTIAYNHRNLVTGISYNDSTPSVGYSYDDYGARTAMTDGEGAMSYVYDSFWRLQTETRTFSGLAGKSYQYTYDFGIGGQLQQVNYSAATSQSEVAPRPAPPRETATQVASSHQPTPPSKAWGKRAAPWFAPLLRYSTQDVWLGNPPRFWRASGKPVASTSAKHATTSTVSGYVRRPASQGAPRWPA